MYAQLLWKYASTCHTGPQMIYVHFMEYTYFLKSIFLISLTDSCCITHVPNEDLIIQNVHNKENSRVLLYMWYTVHRVWLPNSLCMWLDDTSNYQFSSVRLGVGENNTSNLSKHACNYVDVVCVVCTESTVATHEIF